MPIPWTGEICAWDYNTATGDLSGERVFCHVDRSEGGAADGATVDSEGYLWNALVYAGKLVRYTPEGKVDRIIEMPVKKVTSVMFGGENLDVLYVTSMAQPPLPRFPEDNQAARQPVRHLRPGRDRRSGTALRRLNEPPARRDNNNTRRTDSDPDTRRRASCCRDAAE
ncbi:Senescence marker protein-30 [Klebsiella pneumoniae]|uniref:Senescence marker protein-30 n=1 Tax=Klebsiella pneumoniae TaxID=573 RepID=A0A2X3F5F2_KLEPN|nr:Senescence marker protein-30 [Klebsiella pneumoniae]